MPRSRSNKGRRRSTRHPLLAPALYFVVVAGILVAIGFAIVSLMQVEPLGRSRAASITFTDQYATTEFVDTQRSTAQVFIDGDDGVVALPESGSGTWKQADGTITPNIGTVAATGATESAPHMVMENGVPYFVWKADTASTSELRFSRFDEASSSFRGLRSADGIAAYDVVTTEPLVSGAIYDPKIAVRDSQIVVVWTHQTVDPTVLERINAARFNTANSTWQGFSGASEDTISSITSSVRPSEIVIDPNGNTHVAYETSVAGGADDAAYVWHENGTDAWNDRDGTDGFASEDIILDTDGIEAAGVRLRVSMSGGVPVPHVLWREGASGLVRYSRFASGGTAWTGYSSADAVSRTDNLSELYFASLGATDARMELTSAGLPAIAVIANDTDDSVDDDIRFIRRTNSAWAGFDSDGGADSVDSASLAGNISGLAFALGQGDQPCVLFAIANAYVSCHRDGAWRGLATSERHDTIAANQFNTGVSVSNIALVRGLKIDSTDRVNLLLIGNRSGGNGDAIVIRHTDTGYAGPETGDGVAAFDNVTEGQRTVPESSELFFGLSGNGSPHLGFLRTGSSVVHTMYGPQLLGSGELVSKNVNESADLVTNVKIEADYQANGGSVSAAVSRDLVNWTAAPFGTAVSAFSAEQSGPTAQANPPLYYKLSLTGAATGKSPEVNSVTLTSSTTVVAPGSPSPVFNSERIAGDKRITTTIEINKKRFPAADSADAALLCNAANPVDCLAASPLAVEMNAALLLNTTDHLDSDVAAELDRVMTTADTVIVLGLQAAQADQVVNDLLGLGYGAVQRMGGDTRIGTAALITESLRLQSSGPLKRIFIASGFKGTVDALTAAAPAGIPDQDGVLTGILLITDTGVPSETAQELAANPSVTEVFAFGGTAVINDSAFSSLQSLVPNATVTRIADADRYLTAVQAAQTFFSNPTAIVVAAGSSPSGGLAVDALGGGPLASLVQGPIVLVRQDSLPTGVATYLNSVTSSVTNLYTLGGIAAVADAVVSSVIAALGH